MVHQKSITHKVLHEMGTFHIIISPPTDQISRGWIVYYEKEGSWANSDTVSIEIKHHEIIGNSYDTVLSDCKQWISENIGNNFTIQKVD